MANNEVLGKITGIDCYAVKTELNNNVIPELVRDYIRKAGTPLSDDDKVKVTPVRKKSGLRWELRDCGKRNQFWVTLHNDKTLIIEKFAWIPSADERINRAIETNDKLPEAQLVKGSEAKQVEYRTNRIKILGRRSVADSIEIGEHLVAMKKLLDHGEFGPWLRNEFGWSHTTATRLMNVAKLRNEILKFAQFDCAPSLLCMIAQPKISGEVRSDLLKLAKSGEKLTCESVKGIINKYISPKQAKQRIPKAAPTDSFSSRQMVYKELDIELPEAIAQEFEKYEDESVAFVVGEYVILRRTDLG